MTARVAVAAAVLAGGASSRFGSDKSIARLGGRTLVERVVSTLRAADVELVATVGGPGRPALGTIAVADEHPGEGPLGGVLTALRWSAAPRTVVVATDVPLLDELTVRALVERSTSRPGAVAVARADGRLQPTCACWPAGAADVVAARFASGERSVARALADVPVEPVDVPGWLLADIDTPADLDRLATAWSR